MVPLTTQSTHRPRRLSGAIFSKNGKSEHSGKRRWNRHLYYPLIEILNSLRLDLRHASLPPLAIYLHYALRAAPRLTQIHLANLIQAFYQRIVLALTVQEYSHLSAECQAAGDPPYPAAPAGGTAKENRRRRSVSGADCRQSGVAVIAKVVTDVTGVAIRISKPWKNNIFKENGLPRQCAHQCH